MLVFSSESKRDALLLQVADSALLRTVRNQARRRTLLTVGKPSRLAAGTPAAQEVRRDASLTVGKPSRLASGMPAAQEVRRDALLTEASRPGLLRGASQRQRGKAGRITYVSFSNNLAGRDHRCPIRCRSAVRRLMNIQLTLDYQTILRNESRPVHLVAKLTAQKLETHARPRSAAFAVVLDRSSSMSGSRFSWPANPAPPLFAICVPTTISAWLSSTILPKW